MALSFPIASHPANPVQVPSYVVDGLTGPELLKQTLGYSEGLNVADTLQFGFRGENEYEWHWQDIATARFPYVVPESNGFVSTVFKAYAQHHALIVRPDDVWLAILSQFNFFVNGNAEALRKSFVAHEGKRTLSISGPSPHYGEMARKMADLIHENVVDPYLRDWAIPSFTTTTDTDRTVASVLLMATLSQYFDYEFYIICGIPRITIEGTREDWLLILQRLEKLKEYGVETIAWYHLLRPVIAHFVAAFDPSERGKPEHKEFWRRVAHQEPKDDYCGAPQYISGWLNAFNAFNQDGKWMGHELKNDSIITSIPPSSLPADEFWHSYLADPHIASRKLNPDALFLDGTPFHKIALTDIPSAFAFVNVSVPVAGEKPKPCAMVAGVVGMQVMDGESKGKKDTVRPFVGWWMYEKKPEVKRSKYSQDESEL
ncbi:hypothetical protein C8F01DRAFT_1144704 [Mycena amicta]|nr:hypothetical protein C8F01DRAFT_1144704 [Mycena amicta]